MEVFFPILVIKLRRPYSRDKVCRIRAFSPYRVVERRINSSEAVIGS